MVKAQLSIRIKKTGYAIFQTDWGWIGVVCSESGLRRIILPQPSYDAVHQLIAADLESAEWNRCRSIDVFQKLALYLDGKFVDFNDPLDLLGTSQFQRDVWQATCSIPYGETRSYSWVARRIGVSQAARAVGQALAHNPVPIVVPCHRVVASNGNLHGFRGGLALKQRLITMEQFGLKK